MFFANIQAKIMKNITKSIVLNVCHLERKVLSNIFRIS